jgi:hypothetical protein
MWNLFSRTRQINCPDGRPAIVYKRIDEAIPLEIRNTQTKAGGRGNLSNVGSVELDSTYSSSVEKILVAINDRNGSQVLDFRNAYLAYMSDPCGNRDFLARITARIMEDRAFLDRMQIRADTLVELIKQSPKNGGQILELSRSIMTDLNLPSISGTMQAIRDARDDAQEMLGAR